VVKNAFGILKKTFKEIMSKTKMDITLVPNILPNVVFCTTWFFTHSQLLEGFKCESQIENSERAKS
jgi:hypothetical protein